MPPTRSASKRSRSRSKTPLKATKNNKKETTTTPTSKTKAINKVPRGGATEIPRPPGLLRRTFPGFPWMALPDILTYLRLLSIPLVVVLFHTPLPPSCAPFTNHHLVSFIYALASYTDYLDGYLARRWSIASPFGAFLDPVADKLMVSTTLILLSGLYGTIVSVPTSLIIAREISVSALREWMSGKGLRDVVKVGWSGKAKTAVTMVASTILLAVKPTGRGEIEEKVFKAAMAGIYLSALLTVTSGWGYFDAAKGELMQGRKIGR